MQSAVIENGTVTNIIEIPNGSNHTDFGGVPVDTQVGIGWTFDGVAFFPPPSQPVDQVAALLAERSTMVITPMQGILTLGEAEWGRVQAYAATASWAEQVVINSAQEWRRLSQNMQFIGYLLGYTDAQMDDLFRAAMGVAA